MSCHTGHGQGWSGDTWPPPAGTLVAWVGPAPGNDGPGIPSGMVGVVTDWVDSNPDIGGRAVDVVWAEREFCVYQGEIRPATTAELASYQLDHESGL